MRCLGCVAALLVSASLAGAQRYVDASGRLRIALAKQPFLPNGMSNGPTTMADGGIDKIYVHIDLDVLDPREVMGHQNKVPNGPLSEQLAKLFEEIFARYPKASAIGFATIPTVDEGRLSLAAVNRMIVAAVTGLKRRELRAAR